MRRIVFMIGGPEFHPVGEQAGRIAHWLGEGYCCELVYGQDAMSRLEGANLLVVMGLFWPGMSAEWAGGMRYEPMSVENRKCVREYIESGKPVVSHHGGIASYPETPEFAALCGWAWVWETTTHSPFGVWKTRMIDREHEVVKGLGDFEVEDEIYYRVKVIEPGRERVHAVADFEGVAHPMVSTREAGVCGGVSSGRRVYLANGHDMKAFGGDGGKAMRQLWINSVGWALGQMK